MLPVNLNPMVPMSPGVLSDLKRLVKKTLSATIKMNKAVKAEQSIRFDGDMNNVTVGDIHMTIHASVEVVSHLHEIKNIVDKLAIAPPGSTPVKQVFHTPPKQLEYRGSIINLDTLQLENIKAKVICIALNKHGWNRTHAAEELGVSVRALRDWINKYGLKEEQKERK